MKAQDLLDSYPGSPPEPTESDPFVQIRWLFAQRMSGVPTEDGKENYSTGLSHYLDFLRATRGPAPVYLKDVLHPIALIELKSWLLGGAAHLGSYSRAGVMSAVRGAFNQAVRYGLIECFVNATMPAGWRETSSHEVYSEAELTAIFDAVREEHGYILKVLAGYTRTGLGRNPAEKGPRGSNPQGPRRGFKSDYGWGPFNNMVWYFENELDCRPINWTETRNRADINFLQAISNKHGGMRDFYRQLGVSAYMDAWMLGPLVTQLHYLTGLNPFSVSMLRADCLSEHPLVRSKVLTYTKLRSGGEKELLVDLLNGAKEEQDIGDVVEERIYLGREQAILVERCISRILKATSKIRQRAPESLRNLLLIYESPATRWKREVQHFNLRKVNTWCKELIEQRGLLNADGSRMVFTMVRFRPTRLTEMARQGKDYVEIQQVAGHKEISTTVGYIDERVHGGVTDKVVISALDTIWANKREYEASDAPAREAPKAPFRALMCDCRNPFDPPKQVRMEKGYAEGQACTRPNMCLFCDNILLTRKDLPYIAYYRSQVQRALGPESNTDVPLLPHYRRTLAVCDQILDPDTSDFSEEDISWAVEVSADVDMVIDELVYVGMED